MVKNLFWTVEDIRFLKKSFVHNPLEMQIAIIGDCEQIFIPSLLSIRSTLSLKILIMWVFSITYI